MREIDSNLIAAYRSAGFAPIILAMFTFRSGTQYVWSGYGNLLWNAQTYKGVGTLGTIGDITESTEPKASGTVVSLSGIDKTILAECLTDIQLGAPARIWYGALSTAGQMVGSPYLVFSGQVDKAPVKVGAQAINISLNLESRMINHARASARRYTTADQHANGHPTDTAFNSVELLNDVSLRWGS